MPWVRPFFIQVQHHLTMQPSHPGEKDETTKAMCPAGLAQEILEVLKAEA